MLKGGDFPGSDSSVDEPGYVAPMANFMIRKWSELGEGDAKSLEWSAAASYLL
jgi:hypothetical protein